MRGERASAKTNGGTHRRSYSHLGGLGKFAQGESALASHPEKAPIALEPRTLSPNAQQLTRPVQSLQPAAPTNAYATTRTTLARR